MRSTIFVVFLHPRARNWWLTDSLYELVTVPPVKHDKRMTAVLCCRSNFLTALVTLLLRSWPRSHLPFWGVWGRAKFHMTPKVVNNLCSQLSFCLWFPWTAGIFLVSILDTRASFDIKNQTHSIFCLELSLVQVLTWSKSIKMRN